MVPPRRRQPVLARYHYLRSAYRGRHLRPPIRLRWILLAGLSAVYVIQFVGGDHGLLRRMHLERELGDVVAANTQLRLQKERLLQEVQLSENDPFSLERLAREKYWMIGPDEVIFRFLDDEVVTDADERSGDEGIEDAEEEQ